MAGFWEHNDDKSTSVKESNFLTSSYRILDEGCVSVKG